jgi:hypothetical protein
VPRTVKDGRGSLQNLPGVVSLSPFVLLCDGSHVLLNAGSVHDGRELISNRLLVDDL